MGLATGRIYPHISFSPVVELDEDGSHAKGRFRILAMLGGYGGNATWFHGAYENAYVKEQGIWKLNEIANTAQISGSFANGLSAQSKAPLDQPKFAFHYEPDQVGSIALAPFVVLLMKVKKMKYQRRLHQYSKVSICWMTKQPSSTCSISTAIILTSMSGIN